MELIEDDGAELVRPLNELTTLTHNRSLGNDLFLQWHEEVRVGQWRVGVKAFGENTMQPIGGGAGLINALREGSVALREQQVKPTRRPKTTRRRAAR